MCQLVLPEISATQNFPELIEIRKCLPLLDTNFLDHSDKVARIIFLTTVNTNYIVLQNQGFPLL
jgi:hypothetical protein